MASIKTSAPPSTISGDELKSQSEQQLYYA
jgi:hypothetical protein